MTLTLKRLKSDSTATSGYLSINGKVMCFTLEDAFHVAKIPGETRIPNGVYEIKLRNEGGLTQKYLEKYGSNFHHGMLHLQDVPDYEWVYIHTGNTHRHTEGCILVGMSSSLIEDEKNVGYSIDTYKTIYPIISDAILSGDQVFIEILDEQSV